MYQFFRIIPVGRIPIIGKLLGRLYVRILETKFISSAEYWRTRYRKGGYSGRGSYGKSATFKASVLNEFVKKQGISSVIEFGCGDGNQLRLAEYPTYLGFDISSEAIALCRSIFAQDGTKSFRLMEAYRDEKADLALSLDEIYHLIEDDVFESHMKMLFDSSNAFVAIYSSNTDQQEEIQAPHVRHRKFTRWIDRHAAGWKLIEIIPNRYRSPESSGGEFIADFYFYQEN
ncbi:MAG: class I SAM-dependent methyltransferase [Anaerolineales bacterium]|jgi:cyclopropane fatty-acyl-phospholipid synthase-like methyltransferase